MAPDKFYLGLVGWPLAHSLSPALQSAALQAAGLDGSYRLYPAPPSPEGEQILDDLAAALRRGELHGLNVTIPHKQAVLPWLDRLSAAARAVGAVTPISLDGAALVGDNTDIPGFLGGLAELPLERRHTALVLGAGGAARAVVYGLALSWRRIFLAARRLSQAQQATRDLTATMLHEAGGPRSAEIIPLPLSEIALRNAATRYDLIVNATPVGMAPAVDASPWPDSLPFPARAAVYDLVYNPRETALLQTARQAGLATAGGLGMLVEQAALSFERWTGLPAARVAMRAAVGYT